MLHFKLKRTNFDLFVEFLLNKEFDKELILDIFVKEYNSPIKVIFFHNDLANSQDGRNETSIKRVKKLIRKNKKIKVVCCYAGNTGIATNNLLLPNSMYGEIHAGNGNGDGWYVLY